MREFFESLAYGTFAVGATLLLLMFGWVVGAALCAVVVGNLLDWSERRAGK